VAKFVRWEEDNLPIEIKITPGRTRTKTGALIADGEAVVFEIKSVGKAIDLLNY